GLPHRAAAEGDITKSFWYKWSRVIQHHPWPALVLSTALLIVLASPVLFLRLGFADNGNAAEEQSPRRAYDMLSQGFGPGFNGPIIVVAETPNVASDTATLNKLRDAIQMDPGVAPRGVTALFPVDQAATAQMFRV